MVGHYSWFRYFVGVVDPAVYWSLRFLFRGVLMEVFRKGGEQKEQGAVASLTSVILNVGRDTVLVRDLTKVLRHLRLKA